MSKPSRGSRFVDLLSVVVIVGVAAGIALYGVQLVPMLRMMENWVADFRIASLAPAEPQHPEIVIVTISEDTLQRFPYRSPIDRGFLADLLLALEGKGVRGIFLDMLFDQPTEPQKDAALKKRLATMKIPVVVSYGIDPSGAVLNKRQTAFLEDFLPPEQRGFANLVKDSLDGTVRWIYPGQMLANGVFLKGAAGALLAKLGIDTPSQQIAISWRAAPDRKTPPFRTFPSHLAPLLPGAWFKDKIVLVGVELSLSDRHRTPFSLLFRSGQEKKRQGTAGIVIHAHILAQLLDKRLPPDLAHPFPILLVLAAAGFGLVLAWFKINLYLGMVLELLAIAAYWSAGLMLFHYKGVLLPLLAPTLASSFGFLLTMLYAGSRVREQGLVAEAQTRFMRSTFGRYMSTEVAESILDTPEGMALGGKRQEVTVMMTDLRGFTAISEKLPPEEVVSILNMYLEVMTRVITKYKGTIIEFLGDGILILFGAPVIREDDPQRAVASAIEMQLAMPGVNTRIREMGFPELKMGAGINTGTVVAGNIGSEQRSKYGVVGTTINLTARIESFTVGGQLLISESTRQACDPLLRIDDQFQVTPKGIPHPITIYHVGGIGGPYDVFLSKPVEPDYVDVPAGLTVRFAELKGKQAGDMTQTGRVLRLAVDGAEIETTAPPERLTNLKVALFQEEREITRELFAKVMATDSGTPPAMRIAFTSVPTEAEQVFAFILKRDAKG